ncbi:MAG: transcriptional regulator, Crp/Fnr family [Ferruginibacter sp.]|nr:transcriptional regulator, Crp/Fnr family [Ferruginibacter sp.]
MMNIDTLLAWGATYKKLKAGEFVFTQGQNCQFYYQLVSGLIRWVFIGEDGRECIHSLQEPGESFGELPLFDEQPYAASAIAERNAVVIRLHKDTFKQLLMESPQLHQQFSTLFAKRLRYKFSLLQSISTHCPETMINTLLQDLKTDNRNFLTNGDQLCLTRQQIADMTGLRVETVIRTIRTMHEKGTLRISKGKVFYQVRENQQS